FGINKWYQNFALRNFDLEDMDLESTNSGPTAKLPIRKLGKYEMWVIRIKQYFQIQDYALWEKTNKKNDVKARSLLLMAFPNEHQLTFSQYPDAKSMFAAIETRFRDFHTGNPETELEDLVRLNSPKDKRKTKKKDLGNEAAVKLHDQFEMKREQSYTPK
ncbi:hypothetical protein Tco_0109867, partial [Tanacetum coccineum]